MVNDGHQARRVVVGIISGALAIWVVGVIALVALRRTAEPAARTPTSIGEVDWADTAIQMPTDETDTCPTGTVRVYPAITVFRERIGQSRRAADDRHTPLMVVQPRVAYGDLTGDGVPEAVVEIRCWKYDLDSPGGGRLLVVTMRPDHTLAGLAYVGHAGARYLDVRVTNGLLRVKMGYHYVWPDSADYGPEDPGFTQVLRWNGEVFDLVAGRADTLAFSGQLDARTGSVGGSPVRLPAILRDGVAVCPAARVAFAHSQATVGDIEYGQSRDVLPYDLDGDGDDELIAGIFCFGPDYYAKSVYVFGQGDTDFLTLAVPFANDGRYTIERVDLQGKTIVLRLMEVATGIDSIMTMTWNGERFEPAYGQYRQ
jgi:hypothetical protein